jgi:hypothetical protein
MLAEHEATTLNASLLLEDCVNVNPVLDFNLFKCSSATFPLFIAYKLRKTLLLQLPPMATSPSDSSASSVSHSSSHEPTPEWDPIPTYEKHAPLHWNVDGWDFEVASESDGDLTEGDDIQFLVDGELDSDTSTDWSWTYDGESLDVESFDNDDDPMSGHWMGIGSSNDEDNDDENNDGSTDYGSSDEDSDGSGNDDGDDDGGASQCDEMPPSKCRRLLHGSLLW